MTQTAATWLQVQRRAKHFAENAGWRRVSGDSEHDVSSYINYLHGKALQSSEQRRISDLEAQVRVLTRERDYYSAKARRQTRIIANLNLRQIVERMLLRVKESERDNSESFWKIAVEEAGVNSSSPLKKLMEAYAVKEIKGKGANQTVHLNVDGIKRVGGAGLYSALSTNIQKYRGGECELLEDQWNALDYAILDVLRPAETSIDKDGSVDWRKELVRFVPAKFFHEDGTINWEEETKRYRPPSKKDAAGTTTQAEQVPKGSKTAGKKPVSSSDPAATPLPTEGGDTALIKSA